MIAVILFVVGKSLSAKRFVWYTDRNRGEYYDSRRVLFFNIMPNALPLYEILRSKLLTECPNTSLKVQKSQITFKAKYGYAFVSLKRMKGCPEVFIIVSFGLSHRLNSPRIAIAVEPYPNRWTHHMIVFEAEQLDDELIGWLREAYDFAQTKERRSSL